MTSLQGRLYDANLYEKKKCGFLEKISPKGSCDQVGHLMSQ